MKYKKEEIIETIVKMRLEKSASTKTILDFLQKELNYGQSYAYELLREAREQIREMYRLNGSTLIEEFIGQMEEDMENAKKMKNYKLVFEIRKEIAKLMGMYTEKIDISINTFNAKFPGMDDKKENE